MTQCENLEMLEHRLKEMEIGCKRTIVNGRLRYSSYNYKGATLKGQEVGFTARAPQRRLDINVGRHKSF